MANWLERARREIPQRAGRTTANSAERNPTAVTAVPHLGKSEIVPTSIGSNGSAPPASFREINTANEAAVPITASEEPAIPACLMNIKAIDDAIVAGVLDKCCADSDVRDSFILRAGDVQRPVDFDDDRRSCDQCANLTGRGLCLAARRGEIVASRTYEPVRDWLRRCEGYLPGPDDLDRRLGRERWPGLVRKGAVDAT